MPTAEERLLEQKKEKNKKIKEMNVTDMRNIYRRESAGGQFRNRHIEGLDPIKGDLKAKKDPYEEHFKKRKQMIQNARLASQKMRNLKQLPKLSTSRVQNYSQARNSKASGGDATPTEFQKPKYNQAKVVQEGKNFLKSGSNYRQFLTASIYGITGKVPSIVQSKMQFREKYLKKSPKRMPYS